MSRNRRYDDSILTERMGIETRKKAVAFELGRLGFDVYEDHTHCKFIYNDKQVRFFYRSLWFTGKTVIDDRGFKNLINQIK